MFGDVGGTLGVITTTSSTGCSRAATLAVEGTTASTRTGPGGRGPRAAGRWCDVFEIRDGKIQRCFIYSTPTTPARTPSATPGWPRPGRDPAGPGGGAGAGRGRGSLAALLARCGDQVTRLALPATAAHLAADGLELRSPALGDARVAVEAATRLDHPVDVASSPSRRPSWRRRSRCPRWPWATAWWCRSTASTTRRLAGGRYPPDQVVAGTIRVESTCPASSSTLAAGKAPGTGGGAGRTAGRDRPEVVRDDEATTLWSKLAVLAPIAPPHHPRPPHRGGRAHRGAGRRGLRDRPGRPRPTGSSWTRRPLWPCSSRSRAGCAPRCRSTPPPPDRAGRHRRHHPARRRPRRHRRPRHRPPGRRPPGAIRLGPGLPASARRRRGRSRWRRR